MVRFGPRSPLELDSAASGDLDRSSCVCGTLVANDIRVLELGRLNEAVIKVFRDRPTGNDGRWVGELEGRAVTSVAVGVLGVVW